MPPTKGVLKMDKIRENFSKAYQENADKMNRAKALAEIARKQGNTELARKYRREYIELKSEIDAYAMQIIINNER